MKKHLFFIISVATTFSINCGIINFKNDSTITLFIADHLSFGKIINPNEFFSFNNKEQFFFIYQADFRNSQEFKLLYRLKEESRSQEQFEFSFYDISSKKIESLYPKHFIITTQSRLALEHEQQKLKSDGFSSFDQQSLAPERPQVRFQQKKSATDFPSFYGNDKKTESKKSTKSNFPTVSSGKSKKNSSEAIPHKDVLDSIIAEYNKIQQKKHGGISDEMIKNMMATRRR